MRAVYPLLFLIVLLLIIPVSAEVSWTASGTCWTSSSGSDTIYKLNATGSDTWTVPTGVTSIWYMEIGGGGSGANYYGGGGGSGAVINNTMSVSAGSVLKFTVGGGGADTAQGATVGNDGTNTVFNGVTANGGQGGITTQAQPGTGGAKQSGTTSGRGGGRATNGNSGGGGGGGNSTNGADGTYTGTYAGGAGGDGFTTTITGASETFAEGGGGAAGGLDTAQGGIGGSAATGGHGDNYQSGVRSSTAGKAGSGSGGGGAYYSNNGGSTAGGSGVIIIRYAPATVAPIVQFTITNTSGIAPYITNLTDTSLNTPAAWNWTAYNTGNSTEFVLASTQYRTQWFPEVGNYSIRLNVSNSAGFNKSTLYAANHWVNISAAVPSVLPPIIGWTVSPTTLLFPGRVTFNDTSLYDGTHDPTSYNYTPGDGNVNVSLNARNVSYQYYKRGLWNATLNVSNSAGYNITYQWIRVIGYQG